MANTDDLTDANTGQNWWFLYNLGGNRVLVTGIWNWVMSFGTRLPYPFLATNH